MAQKKKKVSKKPVYRRVRRSNQPRPLSAFVEQELLSHLAHANYEETRRTEHLKDIASSLRVIAQCIVDAATRDRVLRLLTPGTPSATPSATAGVSEAASTPNGAESSHGC